MRDEGGDINFIDEISNLILLSFPGGRVVFGFFLHKGINIAPSFFAFYSPPIADSCGSLVLNVSHINDDCTKDIRHVCERKLYYNLQSHIATTSLADVFRVT